MSRQLYASSALNGGGNCWIASGCHLLELDGRNEVGRLETVAAGFVCEVFILAAADLLVERYRRFQAETSREVRVRQFGQ